MDRYIVRNYEVFERGQYFNNNNEVNVNFSNFLHSITNQKLNKEFCAFMDHLEKIIAAKREYV